MVTAQMQYARLDTEDDEQQTYDSTHAPISRSLYISHFLSTWNSRGFEFGAVLFLATIYPGTLLPMSVYALVRALAAIVFSPAVGGYIDSDNRLAVVRTSILGQRLAVALSCCGFLALLMGRETMSSVVSYGLFTVLVLLASIEKLCIIMNTIAVERDWVVVIAAGDYGLLQELNSRMRRIDLVCKLVSPLAVALLDGYSTRIAVVATLAINSMSVLAEYFLIAWVYRRTPELVRTTTGVSSPQAGDTQAAMFGSAGTAVLGVLGSILRQARAYAKSHAFLPSFSLALLYLTVLSFSGQMITYLLALNHPHVTSFHIGILRTVATMLEISSTWITPSLMDKVGAVRTGIWALSFQAICLSFGIATFWSSESSSPISTTYILIASVILSRIGLWCFDLTAQLLVQNSVDASQRGSFSATESSLQNFFELCTFAMTIVWSRPEEFRVPATISLGAVLVAAGCYARYVRVERGHLVHLPGCCDGVRGWKDVAAGEGGDELGGSDGA